MRALLDGPHGGRDSLGYFALRRDKSVVWSPSGKAAIAYRVLSGVLLASGDPLGDPEAWPGAIKEFMQLADEHAWTPAVIGCSEAGGTAYSRVGGHVGAGVRRRGRRRAVRLLARRPRDAQRAAGLRAARAGRLHGAGVPLGRHHRRGARPAARAGGGLARQRDRARVLDGARTLRRPGRRPVRGGHGVRRRPASCAASCTSCRGATTASRST